MADKHDEGVGGEGAGDAYLASLLADKEAATKDLDRATEVRDKREAEIDRLTTELTPERKEQLEADLRRKDELLAAAQASVNKAQDRYVSLRCVSLIPSTLCFFACISRPHFSLKSF
jgi:hypothetical protein